MENQLLIKAEIREEVGKKIAKKLRREEKIPAIIYGGDKKSEPLSIDVEDIKKVVKSEKGRNTVLKVQQGKSNVDAMVQEIQYDYLSDNIIHVDLIRIDIKKPVIVDIPIHTKGDPIGVKVEDGVFDFVNRTVSIKCLPTDIPKEIVLDIAGLHSGHSIKAQDLSLAEEIELITNPNSVICAVSSKSKSEVLEELEEGEEAEETTEAAGAETEAE